jgi:predicted DCC family thiol-disulfide oxidoreductase YuxK
MTEGPVILFDGVCNLCNGAVNLIIDIDKKNVFRFASLQSEYGKSILQKTALSSANLDTFLLADGDKVYDRSAAALYMFRKLGFPYSLLFSFIVVPAFIRNGVYNLIARNRYKWFGKTEQCRVPTPELKSKFIQ